jgi:hypothetical protein
MNKPFEIQKNYADFLKHIGAVEAGLVWCPRRLRWVKENREEGD